MQIGFHTGTDRFKKVNFGTLKTPELNAWKDAKLKEYHEMQSKK